ncbi:putative membrane protein [Ehrlichia chaffeensis str. Heartland]|uniref:Uncharacterized protein n=1 Tax=Ehrlichia chaffeensis (strain ATCC CRL-10679 / Arkansas) TaxID=205920 RepID=Q2GGU9_EHRCR|nr:hypothetical protein ECH_0519 [Ehrlichia chaffeensis str. Arkansas]AHX03613.1 putative membrane protein [Ehrlichia chaffeensis str. Heartland]AHX05665.1 putative membrane protein [Ehrlichia chaffeensis str. Jax]AHX06656.1 putative membrane protein [Ehrlichia chaffeensis str. Liberty]AHX07997.1 putative membrane protein [Ehrlichia chaffeensis str. Osceola]AHX08734.1 putative membrane protein [Ehrlichia chaffeensis str. Saint Vincent]AHX09071.1 putative membrane protein [Ehrlichia chaffeensi
MHNTRLHYKSNIRLYKYILLIYYPFYTVTLYYFLTLILSNKTM